jgi:hypothetical protein
MHQRCRINSDPSTTYVGDEMSSGDRRVRASVCPRHRQVDAGVVKISRAARWMTVRCRKRSRSCWISGRSASVAWRLTLCAWWVQVDALSSGGRRRDPREIVARRVRFLRRTFVLMGERAQKSVDASGPC